MFYVYLTSPAFAQSASSLPNYSASWFDNTAAVIFGIFKHPIGAINTLIDNLIDFIAGVFPSTPNNLKVAALVDSISSVVPSVGRGVIADFFSKVTICFGLAIVIKVYKLIPFKAS